jgi:hypothetical protein
MGFEPRNEFVATTRRDWLGLIDGDNIDIATRLSETLGKNLTGHKGTENEHAGAVMRKQLLDGGIVEDGLRESLADKRTGNDMDMDPPSGESGCGARPDRGDPGTSEISSIAALCFDLRQKVGDSIHAGECDKVIVLQIAHGFGDPSRIGGWCKRDQRHHDRLGTMATQEPCGDGRLAFRTGDQEPFPG